VGQPQSWWCRRWAGLPKVRTSRQKRKPRASLGGFEVLNTVCHYYSKMPIRAVQ
jgi:hypothetical protein